MARAAPAPMPCRSSSPFWLSALLASVVLSLAPAARAAITINENLITRTHPSHSDPVTRLYISRSDCANDDAFSFVLGLQDYAGATAVQVWATDAGADCTDAAQRTTTAALCWQVYNNGQLTLSYTSQVRVQDIVKGRAGVSRAGTRADCDAPAVGTGTGLEQITLYFLLTNGNNLVGPATNWSTKLDLNGPAAPTGIGLGSGGGILKVSWNAALTDSDVAGYRVYVDSRTVFQGLTDPAPDAGATGAGGSSTTSSCANGASSGNASQSDGGGQSEDGGQSEAGGQSEDGGQSVTGGQSEDGGQSVTGEQSGAGGQSEAGTCEASIPSSATSDASTATTSSSVCNSSLPAGQIPTSALDTLIGATSAGNQGSSATISGLTNGQVYSVAVAAYDLVGNSGPLTSVVCGAPEPVYGFSEAYSEAGGTAGGGFCSIGPRRVAGARGGLGALGALLGMIMLRRHRRAKLCQASPMATLARPGPRPPRDSCDRLEELAQGGSATPPTVLTECHDGDRVL